MPERWLPDHEKYWAHLPGTGHSPDAVPETLQEHIHLVNQYALKIIEAHGLDEVVDRLILDLIEKYDVGDEVGAYLKEMFASVIHFHDYGKVNPNFQSERMENSQFTIDKNIPIGSEHSRLSTFLFLNYNFARIQSAFNEEEQTFLWVFAFLLSNPITRHHASTLDNHINLEESQVAALQKFLDLLKLDNPFSQAAQLIQNWKDLFDCFYQNWQSSSTTFFSEVALVKLCFSVLTAADFSATFDYMNGLNIKDWGIISASDKQRYLETFRSRKAYNKDLIQKLDYYRQLSFDLLQERNTANLNLLRQKLGAEAIVNLREHRDKHLFYLEAPTGGGKTNVSLALALELLEADPRLNKVVYVFPFTTLVSQTFSSIRETLDLQPNEIVELHSKAGFSQREEGQDGVYGTEKRNYIANLFANYPFILMTHVRFFDILKSNRKEINYLLHRMANSVVIIDELQAYSPTHWDKIIFLLSEYARLFNMRIIMMSATLPNIDALLPKGSLMQGKVVRLISNRDQFFLNPNFGKRVEFNFDMLEHPEPRNDEDRARYMETLASQVLEKSEAYAREKNSGVRTIIEFVKKKTAGEFFRLIRPMAEESGFEVLLISGEILEPRRRQIIRRLKEDCIEDKVILVSTQVVEAGVDIDMDIGFKDVSLPDSEEQLAGRVNRNASKSGNVVYLFDFDKKGHVYGKDLRYKTIMKWSKDEREKLRRMVLESKNFGLLYDEVISWLCRQNQDPYMAGTLADYLDCFRRFDFLCVHRELKLIDQDSLTVFVPLEIPASSLTEMELKLIEDFGISLRSDKLDGQEVWNVYEDLVSKSQAKDIDFMEGRIALKQMTSLLALFTFSFFANKPTHLLSTYGEERLGIFFLENWNEIYNLEHGIHNERIEEDFIL